jgi:plasmid stability protein
MGQLIVRNVDDRLVRELKIRAVRHGRSMEAEHREILRASLGQSSARTSFKDLLSAMPDVGRDEDLAPMRDLPRDLPRDLG